MGKGKAILVFCCSIVFMGCTNDDSEQDFFENQIEFESFTINIPEDWTYQIDQGIDTFVGRLMNGKDTIYFDKGYLSFGNLGDVEESERSISFEYLSINGNPAIIEKENTPPEELSGEVRLSAYIDAGGEDEQNRLYTFDAVEEETILKIFKSHRFR